MRVCQVLITIHQVLTHLIHTFSHPITHISPLSHSLGDKDDSHSYLASSAKANNQHKNRGGEKKGLHSLIKGSVGHRNVHIQGCGYTYRLINSTEHVHLEPQDHHHRCCTSSRLMPGYPLTGTMPPYHLALSHPRDHRHAETMRRSTEASRSLHYLRRVWAIRPYLPTLSTSTLAVMAPS